MRFSPKSHVKLHDGSTPPRLTATSMRSFTGLRCCWTASAPNRDPEAAFRWFGIAARSKRADAINMLGRCHQLGWGTPVDFGKAVEHYREAAAKSSDWARFNLGCLMLEGKGVARDTDEAFRLFMSAVEQGHVKSLNMVGRCYENGWGCPQNMAEAIQWFRRSAEAGDFRGQYSYAQVLIEQGMTGRRPALASPRHRSVACRALPRDGEGAVRASRIHACARWPPMRDARAVKLASAGRTAGEQ